MKNKMPWRKRVRAFLKKKYKSHSEHLYKEPNLSYLMKSIEQMKRGQVREIQL